MGKTFIGVRDVDEDTFRKFRAMTIEEKMKLGFALTLAMRKLLEERKKKEKAANNKIKHLLTVKPFDWGQGTEKTSEEIDKILYGLRK